jgi:hypothetical protein
MGDSAMLVEQGHVRDTLEDCLGLQVLTGAALKQRCFPIWSDAHMLVLSVFEVLAL